MELLDQGTYGCIYKPGITCDAKPQSPKYTTKIHAKGPTGSNESNIGEIIRNKIPNYQNYFSPVLESCVVNLAKVDKEDIDQCEFIHSDIISRKPLEYMSSKIKYVEGVTFNKYIESHNKLSIVEHLFKYLLTSVKKLANNNIVHFDIKENNVVVKKNGTPILIDFGISINMNDLDKPLSDIFYAYAPHYATWCPEIHIISYYVNHPSTKKVTKSTIMEIMRNSATIPYLETKDKYIKIATNMEGKSSAQMIKELLKTYKSWDQYSIVTMIAQSMHANNIEPSPQLLNKMKSIIE